MDRKLLRCLWLRKGLRYFICDFIKTFKYLLVLTSITWCAMQVIFSRHAEDKMIERGINEEEVRRAIAAGSKYFQEPDKIVAEYGYFSVVYKLIGDVYFVITVQPRC